MKKRKLRKALKLPFDQSMPIVREALKEDHKVLWLPEVIKWCVRHAKELADIQAAKL